METGGRQDVDNYLYHSSYLILVITFLIEPAELLEYHVPRSFHHATLALGKGISLLYY